MDYVRAERILLKSHPDYTERWLQERIADDPAILGLGDLEVKELERRQPRGGRLDMLLADKANGDRYAVELQLGATDETHLVRTVEYWDVERRRRLDIPHYAVIVAEEVTGRFLNVIRLFNRSIPLIAIELKALRVNGAMTLTATRVVDFQPAATQADEDDSAAATAPVDRDYWAAKGPLDIADRLIAHAAAVTDGRLTPRYTGRYIAMQSGSTPVTGVRIMPRRGATRADFRHEESEEMTARITSTGLPFQYNRRRGRYALEALTMADLDANWDLIDDLVRAALDLPPGAEDAPIGA